MTELQDAGFTNITVAEFSTVKKEQDGKVYSVLFDGRSSYDEGESKGKDIPIKVSVYKLNTLEVEINVLVDGEAGKPKFTIETNLPDGTKLDCELKQGDQTVATETVKVDDGKAEYTDLAKRTRPLSGTYLFTVTMEIGKQPQWAVKNKIGSSADCLVGDFVRQKDDADEQYVYMEYEYISDYAEPTEEEKAEMLENALSEIKYILSPFGENCAVSVEGYLVTVDIWEDGMAQTAALALMENQKAVNSWNENQKYMLQIWDTFQNIIDANGCNDYLVQLNLRNDADTDRILMSVMYYVTYDCVRD